jgi:hypothetical protein
MVKRKSIVKFDEDTISNDLIDMILSNNKYLSRTDDQLFSFEFDESTFLQAFLLLESNSDRFGDDLQDYLNSVVYRLRKIPYNEYIVIDIGDTGFKKRASECFGVGLSSLFMVESFKIQWQNICQIPQDRQLSRFTPDFLAYDSINTYIYESKGTTDPSSISQKMKKALEQSKSYRFLGANNYFGFVGYFPNNRNNIPTSLFIADPPIDNAIHFDDWHVKMFHYKNVLEYSNLKQTLPIFINLLKEKIRLELKQNQRNNGSLSDEDFREFEKLQKKLTTTFGNEYKILDKLEYQNKEFIGKNFEFKYDLNVLKMFLGINSDIIKDIINLQSESNFLENSYHEENDKQISIFSDGTILQLEVK